MWGCYTSPSLYSATFNLRGTTGITKFVPKSFLPFFWHAASYSLKLRESRTPSPSDWPQRLTKSKIHLSFSKHRYQELRSHFHAAVLWKNQRETQGGRSRHAGLKARRLNYSETKPWLVNCVKCFAEVPVEFPFRDFWLNFNCSCIDIQAAVFNSELFHIHFQTGSDF